MDKLKPFTVKWNAIVDKWRCAEHHDKPCYLLPNKTHPSKPKHIPLENNDLDEWATAILNDAATVTNPPRSLEFEDRLKRARQKLATVETTSSSSTVPVIHVHNHVNNSAVGNESLSPPTQHVRPLHLTHSPLKGVEPKNYNGVALESFLKRCSEYYEDPDYLDSFEAMKRDKIGVDLFKDALKCKMEMESLLKDLQKCGIKSADARRMVKAFALWYSSDKDSE
jgi:hypothetical protein